MAWIEQDQPVPRATTEFRLANFDVLHADGSLAFSDSHQMTFTPEASRRDAAARGARAAATKDWPVDWGRVAALGKLLGFLRAEGVQVAIAITPHHPAYWAAVADSPYGRTLKAIEREVGQVAAANGAVVAGGFDPAQAGCHENNFRDYIHLDEACLKAVFDQIPLKPLAN